MNLSLGWPLTETDGSGAEATDVTSKIQIIGNRIYFYLEVTDENCAMLLKELRDLAGYLFTDHVCRFGKDTPLPPIWLHILSPGGSLFAGMAVADQLRQLQVPIHSVIEGYCASAATLISMACTRRYAQPSAMMLIHQLQGEVWGRFDQMKDQMKMHEMAMAMITDFYVRHSKLDEDQVKAILHQESWYTAAQCLEHGFVDEVLGA